MPPKTHAHPSSKRSLPSPTQREFDFGQLPGPAPAISGTLRVPSSLEPSPLSSPPPQEEDLTLFSQNLLLAIGENLLASRIRVRWNTQLRSTAGRAYRTQHLVELNPALLGVPGDEVDRTLRHELAHLVAYRRAGRKRISPHGPEWRQACADLGIPGENRCHSLDFPRHRQRRNFAYVCPQCAREIFRVRRIRVPAACFPCCKTHNQGRFSAAFVLQERRLRHAEEKP